MAASAEQLPLQKLVEVFYLKQQIDDFSDSHTKSEEKLMQKVKRFPNEFFVCTLELDENLRQMAVPDGNGRPIYLDKRLSLPLGTRFVARVDPNDGQGSFSGNLERKARYSMLTKEMQEELQAQEPQKYRVCILHLDGPQNGWAEPVEDESDISRIKITGRSNCGRACHGDEVLIEVKDKIDSSTAQGVVVGVWKQREKLKYKLFVCELLNDYGTLMKPLCKSFPKIGYDNSYAREQVELKLRDENSAAVEEKRRLGVLSSAEKYKLKPYEYANDKFVSVYTPHFDNNRQEFIFTGIEVAEVLKHDCRNLFIICYIEWPVQFWYPQGKVVHVLKESNSLVQMIDLLHVSHSVPPQIRVEGEVEAQVADILRLKKSEFENPSENREDFRKQFTITIDNPETKDMDDAISISQAKDGTLSIGINITDVAEYIAKDSPLDRTAKARSCTVYPTQAAREKGVTVNHMLPPKLAEQTLSLLAGEERKCQSVILRVKIRSDESVEAISSRVCLTVIKSDHRLNKEDVQRALEGNDETLDERTTRMLRLLWRHAKLMRIERLGEAAFYQDSRKVGSYEESNFEASCLVEEMMVAANKTVGEFLASHKSNPQFPIRVQEKPRDVDVRDWLRLHRGCVQHSAELTRCLSLTGVEMSPSNFPFKMPESDASDLQQLCRRNKRLALLMLFDETRFPHLRLAINHWHSISRHAEYRPSDGEQQLHFSLDLTSYVHFTSPMRRYADVMVQRAVRSCLRPNESTTSTQNEDDLEETCDWISFMSGKSRRFGGDCESLQVALELQKEPRRIVATVENVDEEGITFLHKLLSNAPKVSRQLQFRQMSLVAAPDMEKVPHGARCPWSCRIFRHSMSPTSDRLARRENNSAASIKVGGDQFSKAYRPDEILRVKRELVSIKGEYDSSTISYTQMAEADLQNRGAASVFCRGSGIVGEQALRESTVTFHRDVCPGDEMKVQVGAQLNHGILTPTIQLVDVCNSFCVCLMHRRRPVDSFEKMATKRHQRVYADVEEYVDVWQPLVAMESATVAASSKDSVTICDVPLKWHYDSKSGRQFGMFNLTETFCQSSCIKFTDCSASESLKSVASKIEDARNGGRKNLEGIQDVTNAVFKAASPLNRYAEYLCVRVKNSSWVGHGGILFVFSGIHGRCTRCNNDGLHFCNFIVFHLRSTNRGNCIPKPKPEFADLEIIFKFLPNRRQELVIQTLKDSSELSIPSTLIRWKEQFKAIGVEFLQYKEILHQQGVRSLQQTMNGILTSGGCNERQRIALESCIKNRVTIIWGPPGTGKTSTGVMLLYLFALINRRRCNSNEDEEADDDSPTSLPKGVTVQQLLHDQDEDGFRRVPGRRNRSSGRPRGPKKQNLPRWKPKRKRANPQSRPQILCCGPSNRSVDVIVEEAHAKLGSHCPKMVRVYSDQAERRKYPIPGESPAAMARSWEADVSKSMEKFALHELIRTVDSEDAEIIRGFDAMFHHLLHEEPEPGIRALKRSIEAGRSASAWFASFIDTQRTSKNSSRALDTFDCDSSTDTPWETVMQHYVKIYKTKVVDVKVRVLQNFEIVLCTTSVSSTSVIQKACRFMQIVVDEAGMCTQPELLVPLVGRLNPGLDLPSCLGVDQMSVSGRPASQFAERAVLIGDHKQLLPIIQNKTAADFGLSTTFLEQHCLDSVMLNEQYRMHPSLADFPSLQFYSIQRDGGLRTRPSPAWTGLTKEEATKAGRQQWTGLDTHLMRNPRLFDSFDVNSNRSPGLLTKRNVNIFHGCWPGVRRKAFRTLPEVDPEADPASFHAKGEEERIVFLDVRGKEEKTVVATEQGREDSYKNEKEINEVIRIYEETLNRLNYDEREKPKQSVAIISQYKFQVTEIKARLKEKGLPMPTVKTVIACQGSEFSYVILSLVRSLPDYDIPDHVLPGWERKFLGFITDENQTNVALTRARRGLVIIGNKRLLNKCPCWSVLLHDLKMRGCIVHRPGDFPNKTGDRRRQTRDGSL